MKTYLFYDFYDINDHHLKNLIDDLLALLNILGVRIIFLSKTKVGEEIKNTNHSISYTDQGIILTGFSSVFERKLLLQLLTENNVRFLVEMPDLIKIDSLNMFSFKDSIFVGLNKERSIKEIFFIKRKLISSMKKFNNLFVIKTDKFNLIDVFRVVSNDKKNLIFVTKELIYPKITLITDKKVKEVTLSYFDKKDFEIHETSVNDSVMKNNRFLEIGNSIAIFEDADDHINIFNENKFKVIKVSKELFKNEIFPYDSFIRIV